ncbi:hypothetical protein [Thermoactinomyces sp. DSM 45892]|uniref:hypothetical protein n=1 Tax=Thermoactinomyces sp. DSM 45892 TaxID=1882753 RepID=UPI0008983008|nr:hypothetical protein [Thermoactinomyces sp. DSM 45892]SDZ27124.1 hypothetical protein SAMN05444416_11853 [Thermoactinomyces sp. DSM 45892]
MIPDIVDLKAPIIPAESMGGFQLREHIKTYEDVISWFGIISSQITNQCSTKYWEMRVPFQINYEIRDSLVLIFNVLDGRLRHIIAYPSYKGTLFGEICMGMKISKAIQIDSRIEFDEEEEVYHIPEIPGLAIDTTLDEDDVEVIDRIAVFTEEVS